MMLMLEMLEYELNGVMTSFKSFDFLCTVATLNLVTIDEASNVHIFLHIEYCVRIMCECRTIEYLVLMAGPSSFIRGY